MSNPSRRPTVHRRSSRKRRRQGSLTTWLWVVGLLCVIVGLSWVLYRYGLTYKEYRAKFLHLIGRAPIEEAIEQTSFTDSVLREGIALGADSLGIRFEPRPNGYYVTIPLPRGGEWTVGKAKDQLKLTLKKAGGEFLSQEENPSGTYALLRFSSPREKKEYTLKILYDTRRASTDNQPKMAIVIDDFGYYGDELLESYIRRMPYGVTFAIIPGLPFSEKVMRRAADFKHETIIHMPMQPENDKEDPGKGAIRVDMDPEKIAKLINDSSLQLPLCMGLSNHMGSKATSDEPTMRAVMTTLRDRHLYFLDSRTTTKTVAARVAHSMNLPFTEKDLFIDVPDVTEKTLKLRLEDIAKLKEKKKNIVVIVHCKDRSYLNYTAKFCDAVKEMGFTIVPVSDIIKANR